MPSHSDLVFASRLIRATLAAAVALYALYQLSVIGSAYAPVFERASAAGKPTPASSSTATEASSAWPPPESLADHFDCRRCAALPHGEGVFTCTHCIDLGDSFALQPPPAARPGHPSSVDVLLHTLASDYVADGGLTAFLHCQWYTSWWCHRPVVWLVECLIFVSTLRIDVSLNLILVVFWTIGTLVAYAMCMYSAQQSHSVALAKERTAADVARFQDITGQIAALPRE